MSESLLPFADLQPAHRRRLDWALHDTSQSLLKAIQRDHSQTASVLRDSAASDLAERLVRLIMEQADPTSNKRFTPWLTREYAAGRLILEDLGSANETLSLFKRYAPRLKPAERDIQRYGSLAAAWEAVRRFAEREEAQSNKAQRALDRAKAYAQSRILRQDPDGFTVAVPLTEFAAKWWGRGTRWCTAAEKDNQFWQYHKKAPLVVLVVPDYGKFQLWVTRDRFHFMDAADQEVSATTCTALWHWIKPHLVMAVSQNARVLNRVPVENRSYDVFLSLMRGNGSRFNLVPANMRSYEMCLTAVQSNGQALQYLPDSHRSQEVCLAAVQQNGDALQWVPEEKRTEELCLAAVQQYGGALQWVPEKHRTHDLCLLALLKGGLNFRCLPSHYQNSTFCLESVQRDGMAISRVPHKYKNREICLAAVRQNGFALEWIPSELRDEEICQNSIEQYGSMLTEVPESKRSYEICLAAVMSLGTVLPWVPEEHHTDEVYLAAVRQNGSALRYVPKRFRDQKICSIAVRNYGWALAWVPEDLRTRELCLLAVAQDGRAIRFVPKELKSLDLCRLAMQHNGDELGWVPDELRNLEICLLALKSGEKAMRYIPSYLKDVLETELPPEQRRRGQPLSPEWSSSLLDEWASVSARASSHSNEAEVQHV